jgi:hypothetical protein
MTIMTSREFNQDVGRAKRSAETGPVVITDRGRPAYVLLRHDAYTGLLGGRPGIRDLLDSTDLAGDAPEFDFDPAPLSGPLVRAADLG